MNFFMYFLFFIYSGVALGGLIISHDLAPRFRMEDETPEEAAERDSKHEAFLTAQINSIVTLAQRIGGQLAEAAQGSITTSYNSQIVKILSQKQPEPEQNANG